MKSNVNKRVLMCVGTYPEDNYRDFPVYYPIPDEWTNEEAIKKAQEGYSENHEFYIIDEQTFLKNHQ